MADREVVAVVGLGVVGLATAVRLGRSRRIYDLRFGPDMGHADLVLVDRDPAVRASVLRVLHADEPVHGEPGLADLLRAWVGTGWRGDVRVSEALPDRVDSVVVCVGTGVDDLDPRALRQLLGALAERDDQPMVLVRSTSDLQTTTSFAMRMGERLAVAPEFLREGHAAADRDTVVLGVVGDRAWDHWSGWLLPSDRSAGLQRCLPLEASMAKLARNYALRQRVELADVVSTACEMVPQGRPAQGEHPLASPDHASASASVVLQLVGADPRIGPDYLAPGLGPGGSCLRKDSLELECYRPEAGRAAWLGKRVALDLQAQRVLVVGAGFKPDSPDVRGSTVRDLVEVLVDRGLEVHVWDPRLRDPEVHLAGWGCRLAATVDSARPQAVVVAAESGDGHLVDCALMVACREAATVWDPYGLVAARLGRPVYDSPDHLDRHWDLVHPHPTTTAQLWVHVGGERRPRRVRVHGQGTTPPDGQPA